MRMRLRALGLPEGRFEGTQDSDTADAVDRLILVEVCRRFLTGLSDAEVPAHTERRIESYAAEYKEGLAVFDSLPSDYFSNIAVVKTIVRAGRRPKRRQHCAGAVGQRRRSAKRPCAAAGLRGP